VLVAIFGGVEAPYSEMLAASLGWDSSRARSISNAEPSTAHRQLPLSEDCDILSAAMIPALHASNDGASSMGHIVLLGDSIFDNGPYVARGGTTLDELTARLRDGWHATLLALDGSVTSDVTGQLRKIPKSATHLVISSGGNDALMQQSMLHEQVSTAGEAFFVLGSAVRHFEQDYRALLRAAVKTGLPTIVCTIYNGNFPDPEESVVTSTALAPYNDVIIRAAWASKLPILDLRVVCDRPEHYANPIEPSTAGSARIAEEILRMIQGGAPE
jgi:hypothetical protein